MNLHIQIRRMADGSRWIAEIGRVPAVRREVRKPVHSFVEGQLFWIAACCEHPSDLRMSAISENDSVLK